MPARWLQGQWGEKKKIKLLSKVIQADSVNEASLKIHKTEIYMSCIVKLQKKREIKYY